MTQIAIPTGRKLAIPSGQKISFPDLRHVLPGRAGLRFAVPGRWGRDALWSAGRKLVQVPLSQASDADRAYFPYFGGIKKGVAGKVPIGGYDVASKDGGLLLEVAETNPAPDFDSWSTTGATTITGGQNDPFGGTGAYLLGNLGEVAVDDILKTFIITGKTEDDKFSAGIMIHPNGKTGTLTVLNEQAAKGDWDVDLSALSQTWHRITNDHAAVTVVQEFRATPNGRGGFIIHAGSGDCDCLVFWPNLIDSGQYEIGSAIAPAATRAVDDLDYAGGPTNVNANAGTIYLVWTPIGPESGRRGQSGRANLSGLLNGDNDILYFPAGDQLFFFMTDSGGSKNTVLGGLTLTRGTKIVVAATWDGSEIIVYADGVGGTPTAAGAMADVGTIITIGNRGGGGTPDRPADGQVSGYHLYDYAHDPALVAANSVLLAAM